METKKIAESNVRKQWSKPSGNCNYTACLREKTTRCPHDFLVFLSMIYCTTDCILKKVKYYNTKLINHTIYMSVL